MKAVLLENPRAGRASAEAVAAAMRRLAEDGWEIAVVRPESAEKLEDWGASPPDVEAVFVAGGDGTLSRLVQRWPSGAPPIALLPVGTANVVARDLGLPLDPVAAAAVMAASRLVRIDVGRVERAGAASRRFVLSTSAGAIGAAVAGVSERWKRRFGAASYGFSYLGALLRTPSLKASIDGGRVLAGSVIVTVTRHYAGGFVLDPQSRPGDGRLDIYVVPPGVAGAAWSLSALRSRVRAVRAVEVVVDAGAALECDGDPAGETPCRIVLDAGITMLGVSEGDDATQAIPAGEDERAGGRR